MCDDKPLVACVVLGRIEQHAPYVGPRYDTWVVAIAPTERVAKQYADRLTQQAEVVQAMREYNTFVTDYTVMKETGYDDTRGINVCDTTEIQYLVVPARVVYE